MIYDVNSPLFRSFLSQKGGSAADKREIRGAEAKGAETQGEREQTCDDRMT
ncbi:hypothetical protein MUK42_35484 [Musa troglodytarum]|uniref:Wound-induced basic protein n=1 Tax=Musa troglodytarum TaxID=320322 RepID=A0A9E7KHK2_9LILI|nr:hypothetical protein MUK42_35484 [Musa troglodytarum]